MARVLERLLAVEFLLQYCTCLPDGGEAVWLKLGSGGCRAADNFVERPNDVNFCVRASKEEDPQLLGQPLRCWALGI